MFGDLLTLYFDDVRSTSSTTMNNASSRSHAIFTIIFESESTVDGNRVNRCGKINFVDLAGSERLYKARPFLILELKMY